jgi:hypothetical protein
MQGVVSSGLQPVHRLAALVWALLWSLGLPLAAAAAPAERLGNTITGTWASTTGAERLVFLPGGYFRSCFVNGRKGNASMGRWKRLGPGRYAVEFTHTATPACNLPPQAIRQHPASILGQVLVQKGELSLYVSGEFPPDIYRPVPPAR